MKATDGWDGAWAKLSEYYFASAKAARDAGEDYRSRILTELAEAYREEGIRAGEISAPHPTRPEGDDA